MRGYSANKRDAKAAEGSLAGRRRLDRVTPEVRKEAQLLSEKYQQRLIQEAASHGLVTAQSLRAADQQLRRRKLTNRGGLWAYPRTWDTITGLGGIGITVDAVYATVHPFAAGSIGGLAGLATVGATGLVGGWIARWRRDEP